MDHCFYNHDFSIANDGMSFEHFFWNGQIQTVVLFLNVLIFVLFAIIFAWFTFTFAFAFIGTTFTKAQKLDKFLWNGRIEKLQKPPFSLFLKAYESKNYFLSFIMVIICNIPGHLMMFVFGASKIGLLMIIVQPFMQGAIVGMGDEKTRVYGVVTSIFEVTGFVTSCCLGFFWAVELWWIPAIFLILNAIVEASGVLIGAQGVPGVEAVKNKLYK